ncbi:hypothetical protein [Nocardia sp. MW-W600-9]
MSDRKHEEVRTQRDVLASIDAIRRAHNVVTDKDGRVTSATPQRYDGHGRVDGPATQDQA